MAIPNPFDFSNRIVLITGAGGGLGRGIAQRFGEAGARVAIHYRASRETAETTAAAIRETGAAAMTFPADLDRPEEVERLFAQVRTAYGGLDILINNAGKYVSSGLVEMAVAEWDQIVSANLRSVFLCTQAAARLMIETGRGGAVINIASIEGTFPAPGHAHYSSAKAAVLMYTRSAAQELGQHQIRVNAVSPGLIARAGIEQAWPAGVASWMETAPLKRMGTPTDVADACLFLASPAASWISGANLVVDGGVSTRPAF